MTPIRVIAPAGSRLMAGWQRWGLQRLLKPMFSPTRTVAAQRRRVELLARSQPLPRGVRREPVAHGEWLHPDAPPVRAGSVLYLHGGAYCVGSPASHRSLTMRLARETGLPVLALDYRLAPEHPWPAPVEDALAAFDAMPGPVVIAGDSAGGGLALLTALALRERGGAQAAALWLLSPWVDLAIEPGAWPAPVPGEAMLNADWGAACAAQVLAGQDPAVMSPLRADLRGLPPVLLQFGTDELLHGQGQALHAALDDAGVTLQTECYQGRWHVFQLHAGQLRSADDALRSASAFIHSHLPTIAAEREHEVAILGAGMSGIAMAIRLQRAGIRDLVMVERSAGLGGTWWDNRYPGAQVDVPAPAYSFSFAANPHWTHRFADAPEIQRYQQGLAERHRLPARLRLGRTITEARFDAAAGRWRLRLDSGEQISARFFVCSTGPLSEPRWPDIPGLADFQGRLLHTARWPQGDLLAGQRIGVIGTGSTASQLVPALAPGAARLSLFQRTPNWILPRADRRYLAIDRWLTRLPGYARLVRWGWVQVMEWGRRGFDEGTLARRFMLGTAGLHRRRQVADPVLREQLTPRYPLGCKRIIYSNDYYVALQRPNAELVTSPITRVTARGLLTADGREHALDVLVCATGYDTQHPLAQLDIVGLQGRRLADAWAAGAQAYLGVTVPAFPNFFLMLGPNTATGHTSTLLYIEPQAEHVLACIRRVEAQGRRWIAIRPEVAAAQDAAQQQRLRGSVWSRCSSWYRADNGRIVAIWPGFTAEYVKAVRRPDEAAYELG
jgi:cation diffusion facilitator CzcD-associated flavoprotein CzcO/acetyl esterase/lipase